MFKSLKEAIWLLPKKDRWHMLFLLIPMSVSALLNMVGIGFVAPFIAVAADPDAITKHAKLKAVYDYFHFTSAYHFLVFIGIAMFFALVLVNVMGTLTMWLIVRNNSKALVSISHRLLSNYLLRPYAYFIVNNSAALSQNIFQLTNMVVQGVLLSVMYVATNMLRFLCILGLLLYANPTLAIAAGLIIGGIYGLVYILVKKKLANASDLIVREGEISYRLVSEAFGGIKDIKLLGNEANYSQWFLTPQRRIAQATAVTELIKQAPRYVFELAAFGSILLLIVYMLTINHNFSAIMPTMALYVFAGYRLMPTMQNIFSYVAFYRGSASAVTKLKQSLQADIQEEVNAAKREKIFPLALNNAIELSEICFRYPNVEADTIKKLNLIIPAHSMVGFIGSTGAGKTTIIDIILGLLQPQSGSVLVDGIRVEDKNRKNWQRNIGYVPQHIYLADDTVRRNIAFSLADVDIDDVAVEKAARAAAIHDFIVNELPNGYDTKVGERGICLSGGQRQRIGIARALYYNADVLVLDEATSALDGLTEAQIMQSIHALAQQKTIIIIAHRLSTIKNCDIIYLLEKGQLKDSGKFIELSERHQSLREAASLTN